MNQSGNVPVVVTEEEKAMLNEGIGLILSRWTAMKAAVENGWGGRDSLAKAERTVTQVFDYFTLSKGWNLNLLTSLMMFVFNLVAMDKIG